MSASRRVAHVLQAARRFAGPSIAAREEGYLLEHARRFVDTLALLPSPPSPEARLLEIGVYPGFLAALAQDRGYRIAGVGNREMTPSFRERANAAGWPLHEIDIETDRFPFPDDCFHSVTMCEVIEHLYRNPFHPLAEIFRVLKPGGTLVLTTPNLAAVGKITGLLRGNSFHADILGPLDESFPLNPNLKHAREYTADDLRCLLSRQTKLLYRFEVADTRYSRCWDPPAREVVRALLRTPLHGTRMAMESACSLLLPRYRSCLMIRAHKPRQACWIPADAREHISGFYDLESDAEPPDRSRRAIPWPFRWTNGNGRFRVVNPKGTHTAEVLLPCGLLAPGSVPATALTIRVNGQPAAVTTLQPAKELSVIRIPVPRAVSADDTWEFELASETWTPARLGMPDRRELGVMVSWGPMLRI